MKLFSKFWKKEKGIALKQQEEVETLTTKVILGDSSIQKEREEKNIEPEENSKNTVVAQGDFVKKLLQNIVDHDFIMLEPTHEEYVKRKPFQNCFEFINNLEEVKKEFEGTTSLGQIEEILGELKEYIIKIDQIVTSFDAESSKLKNDILLYTKAVNEAAAKYKLSPDWEGKKTPLMNLQKNLEERRNVYIEKNNAIEQLLKEGYEKYIIWYQQLKTCCNGLISKD